MKKVLLVVLCLFLATPNVFAKTKPNKNNPNADDGGGLGGYPSSLINSVTMYPQINSDNCGPASIQIVMKMLGYTPAAQNVIANSIGTTTANGSDANAIAYYLTTHTNKSFAKITISSVSALKNQVKYDVNNKKGMIINFDLNSNPNFSNPNVYGHYAVVYGYDATKVYICDPYPVNTGCCYTLRYEDLYASLGRKYYHVVG